MKAKWKFNPIMRILVFMSVLIFIVVVLAIGMYYYIFEIPEPEGLSLAWWPNRFTDNFSSWMECENGTISIRESGLKRLDEYGLWVQVMDEDGQEVYSYKKPESYPVSYAASELMSLSTSAYADGNTVFVSSFEDAGETWNYIVGFPYAIGKYMLYYNGETTQRLSPVFRMVISLVLCAAVIFTLGYGFWFTRHLWKITKGIENLSLRTYQPLRETGIFKTIYGALNKMDAEIRHSEKIQEETDRTRKEWIANITHDLKTPLSPVKGYAELLSEGSSLDLQTAKDYGTIILKNVNHMEKLMNDLKLTYQLEAGAIPYTPRETRITRFLKELIIDIANDPAFSNRTIEFESEQPEMMIAVDPDLLRRAVGNIVINALVHNPLDTKVKITVNKAPDNSLSISICDNGNGMDETELPDLWSRYYRGTNTKERPEGSGLGLAIAKQIITLHGGDISAKSSPGVGTEFVITLPFGKDEN